MNITHRFNFIDHEGNALCGEVIRNRDGKYIPDSPRGMGKNYDSAIVGVTDYLRRMGGSLKGSLIETAGYKKELAQSQAIGLVHVPAGVLLADFERLDPTCSDVPDWARYTSDQQYSGMLRELSDDYSDESGACSSLCIVLDQAAERLDQAHVEYLEAKAALPLVLPQREPAVEQSLGWAFQHGHAFVAKALTEYCDARALNWNYDPRYNAVTFTEKGAE